MENKSEYIRQYTELHQSSDTFGTASRKIIDEISLMIDHLKPSTVLDFGCGKGLLLKALKDRYPEIAFFGYDPAISGIDVLPVDRADLVINSDVLEHIPEEMIPGVIEQISAISRNAYFNLHHARSRAILPNGENAHCTVRPPEWYHALLKRHFDTVVPLEGRKANRSVVVTFDVPADVADRYRRIIRKGRPLLWKRILRKLFR